MEHKKESTFSAPPHLFSLSPNHLNQLHYGIKNDVLVLLQLQKRERRRRRRMRRRNNQTNLNSIQVNYSNNGRPACFIF